MSAPPRLLPVPSFQHELTIKATHSGIILLKDGRFKKRYTGSRFSAVDINGKFWKSAKELQDHVRSADTGPKRKRAQTSKVSPQLVSAPTEIENESSDPAALSTNKKRSCEYRVNKMEVRQRILTMIQTMRGSKELYFWTITFPLKTSDEVAYRAFNTWLTTLRQKKHLRDYIWIAERQKNGTVHFHIAIPHKMSVVHANRVMRIILTSFCRKKAIDFSVFQCKRYNGVDICKNRKTGRVTNFAIKKGSRALATYLTKYVTKNDEPFKHLAWHNSRGFSALFTGITFTVQEFIAYGFKEVILHRSVISNLFFSFYPWRGEPPGAITKHLAEVNNYIQEQSIKTE